LAGNRDAEPPHTSSGTPALFVRWSRRRRGRAVAQMV